VGKVGTAKLYAPRRIMTSHSPLRADVGYALIAPRQAQQKTFIGGIDGF
jgi:hypothetical protein